MNQPPINIQDDINLELKNIKKKKKEEILKTENYSSSKDIKIKKVKPLFPKTNSELRRFNDMLKAYKFIIIEIILILLMEIGGYFFYF